MIPQRVKNWKVSDVFNVFVATFIIEFLLFTLLKSFGVGEFVDNISTIPFLRGVSVLFFYLLQVAGMLIPLWYFVIRKYKSDIKDFAFKWIGTAKTILWVISSYIFYLGISVLLIMIFTSFGIERFGFEPQTSIFEIFGKDWFGLFIGVIIALVIAPLVEEVFFRGFVLKTLMKKIGSFWAVTITALIFASVHFEFQSLMPLLVLSVIINVIFIKTKSIWPGLIFHAFNNTIGFIVLYLIETNQFFL